MSRNPTLRDGKPRFSIFVNRMSGRMGFLGYAATLRDRLKGEVYDFAGRTHEKAARKAWTQIDEIMADEGTADLFRGIAQRAAARV